MTKEPKTATSAPASTIDWPEVRRRLEQSKAFLEQAATRPMGEQKNILKARAKALACELNADESGHERLEIIEFLLAHERYALELRFVREVYPLKELTSLPGTPPFVRGIINVRGRIVCVVDLKKFFDLPERGLTDLNKVIIVSDGAHEFGLLADAVMAVSRVAQEQIQRALPTLTGIRLDYLKGITSDRLVILDAVKILADPRLALRGQAQT